MTDIELINRVKEKNDSSALSELIDRHSGMYVKIVQKYSAIEKNSNYLSNKLDINELRDDKTYNMYKYILSYNPNRNTKFSTYVGQMTRYLCLGILNDTPEKIEINEFNSPIIIDTPIDNSTNYKEELKKRAKEIEDPLFWPIFEMRHLMERTYSWREIAKENKISYEWARQIYNKHIKHIRNYINT